MGQCFAIAITMKASSKLAACLLNISEAKNKNIVEKIARAGIVKSFSDKEQQYYANAYAKGNGMHATDSQNSSTRTEKECGQHTTDQNSEQSRRHELVQLLFGDKNLNSQTSILNIFSDIVYNRSVVTIAGTLPGVETGVTAACLEAFRLLQGRYKEKRITQKYLSVMHLCCVLLYYSLWSKTFCFDAGIDCHTGGHPRKGMVDLIPIHPITKGTSLDDCAKIATRISQKIQVQAAKDVDIFHFGHADRPLKRSLVTRRKEVNWYSKSFTGINNF